MDGMDTKTMVHIASEILLIGGLGFWMKKRVDTLDAQVDEMSKKLTVYENIIQQQQQLLAKHEAVLQQISSLPPVQTMLRQMYATPQLPLTENKQPTILQQPDPQKAVPQPPRLEKESLVKPSEQGRQAPPPPPAATEKDISPEELDKILQEELSRQIEIETEEPEPLKQKRKGTANRKKKLTNVEI